MKKDILGAIIEVILRAVLVHGLTVQLQKRRIFRHGTNFRRLIFTWIS